MEKFIYHGGAPSKPKFSQGGGGGGVTTSQWLTLPWVWADTLAVNVEVPAPAYGGWDGDTHGYYLGIAYSLRELHLLYNRVVTFGSGMTITFQLRRRIADGSGAASSLVTSLATTLPNTEGGSDYYVGDALTGLNIVCPNGYNYYGIISGKSANTVEGLSVWGLFERGIE